jgi:pimeloyl-ACP methyl ester carboxylesterase
VRWQAELARLLADPVFRGAGVPRGDGTPVLAIPGFLAGRRIARGDARLAGAARVRAGRLGHHHERRLLRARAGEARRAPRRALRAHGRPVALLGHSRGAHFAKALAHWRPERTAGVISLGAGLDSPFDISVPTKAAVAAVRAVHQRLDHGRAECMTVHCGCPFAQHYAAPFPAHIPLTSIYSREDGVVWWEACIVPYARNVEVTGSHVGLAANRKAYVAIAEALAAMRASD